MQSPPHCYKSNNLPYPLSSPEASLCPPRAFYFFDYCYFYRDTQREPLRIQERVPYRCQQLAAQFTVSTSFPGFSQREPGNEVAHRSTALNLPSSAQLTAFCTYRLDQLPYFLCFNLVLSLFSATGVSSLEFCFSCFVRVIVMGVLALILFWVCKKHSNLITSSLSFSSPPARKKESSARRPP